MAPDNSSDLTVETLLALRQEDDAIRLITERLKVKEMGPADHIRTKHEVKTFIESNGDAKAAEALILQAQKRRGIQQGLANVPKQSERRGLGQTMQ
jgi:hypothetical protein